MALRKSKKLLEITNTPNSKRHTLDEPERCFVTNDKEILDLKLEISDDELELFSGFELDMNELKFK